eukprot:scaffold71606_cov25-Phaeocystis_antarctica.AAC.1
MHLPRLRTFGSCFPPLVALSRSFLAGAAASTRCAPEPSPNPAPAHPFSTPAATVSDGMLGSAAGSTPVTILTALATLTPWPLLARA